MSRLELMDTVRVLDTCPDVRFRGKEGVIVGDSGLWSAWYVEIVLDGKTYRPLIAVRHLQKITPESEGPSFAQGRCPNCGHDYTAHGAWIAHPGDTTCEEVPS